jgi:hypothetical protein
MRLTMKVLTSIPFAVIASLALIVTAVAAVTGKELPFGVAAGVRGAAMVVGTMYTVATIRLHQRRREERQVSNDPEAHPSPRR